MCSLNRTDGLAPRIQAATQCIGGLANCSGLYLTVTAYSMSSGNGRFSPVLARCLIQQLRASRLPCSIAVDWANSPKKPARYLSFSLLQRTPSCSSVEQPVSSPWGPASSNLKVFAPVTRFHNLILSPRNDNTTSLHAGKASSWHGHSDRTVKSQKTQPAFQVCWFLGKGE